MCCFNYYFYPGRLCITSLYAQNFQVDPYLFIGDDFQLHVRPQANMKDFGSSSDSQTATSMLFEMRSKVELSNTIIIDIVAKNLSKLSKVNIIFSFSQ